MAINVYLTIFWRYRPEQLKSLEWRYHTVCYGFPFIAAFTLLFIDPSSKGKVYGPAILWCWIDDNWVPLRIALCYGPAWFCILASFCIYVLAGHEIFKKRRQLRAFNFPLGHTAPAENPFTDFKTTEIKITREPAIIHSPDVEIPKTCFISDNKTAMSRAKASSVVSSYDAYTVTIESLPSSLRKDMLASHPSQVRSTLQHGKNRVALEANTAAWGYTKVALLYFISLLVTWVCNDFFCVNEEKS